MVPEMDLLTLDRRYCSSGDISGRRDPKKIFAQALGEWLIDSSGVRYLDLQMCNSAANFGYRSETHANALNAQLNTLPSLASEFIHEGRVLLAKRLARLCEDRWNVSGRVHFSVGGAQAIDDVLKLIGQNTGTTRVFAFESSYHGRTLAASAISGSYRYRAGFGGVALATFVPFPDCDDCPYGRHFRSCAYECVAHVARLFDGEGAGQDDGHGRPECRAFIAEPVLGRGGYIAPPPEYFLRLKEVLNTHGILFVADEVQMGFYRAGHLWSIERYGVVPDVVIFGKSITNGLYPLSGFWARSALTESTVWPPGSSHATFAGAPLGTALGMATLDLCDGADWESAAERVGSAIENTFRELMADFPAIHAVGRVGAALSLDLRDRTGRPWTHFARCLVETGLSGRHVVGGEQLGVVLTTGGGRGNRIMIAPSLTMGEEALALCGPLLRAVFTGAQRHLENDGEGEA